ncbi:MAG: phospholipid carrier-dependent glycosyltransferase [bacterium]|nr:phospholipid carrier-dependent glycosyltransferase [bacterium]
MLSNVYGQKTEPKPDHLWPAVILAAIVLLGLTLRLWGIQFGLPDYFYVDATKTVYPAKRIAHSFLTGKPSLDPGFYQYPTFYINLLALEYTLYGLIQGERIKSDRHLASLSEAVDILYQDQSREYIFFLLARLTSAAAATLTILLLYLAAEAAYQDRRISLLSAFFLAVTYLHVKDAKYPMTDATMAAMATWAWLYILKIIHHQAADGEEVKSLKGRMKDYLLAGLFIGLGTSTKYLPLFLVLPLGMAFLINFFNLNLREQRGQLVRYFAFGLIFILLGFILGTPSFLYQHSRFIERAAGEQKGQYSIGGKPGDVQQGYFDYLFCQNPTYNEPLAQNSLMGSMGIPLLVLTLAGIFFTLQRGVVQKLKPGNVDLILSLSCLIFYALLAKPGQLRTVRHFYWFLPIYALLASRVLVSASEKILPSKKHLLIPLLGILAASPTLWRTVRFDYLLSHTDNRFFAQKWIDENLPTGSRILMPNLYHPKISTEKFQIFFYNRNTINEGVLSYEALVANGINYFITSSYFDDRYFTQEALKEFPAIVSHYQEFYRSLRERGKLVKEFEANLTNRPGPTIRVFKII